MLLLIDNYDSFTFNLVQRIGEIDPDLEVRVVRNDRITPDEAAGCSESLNLDPLEVAVPNELPRSPERRSRVCVALAHRTKRSRPLAGGRVSSTSASTMCCWFRPADGEKRRPSALPSSCSRRMGGSPGMRSIKANPAAMTTGAARSPSVVTAVDAA